MLLSATAYGATTRAVAMPSPVQMTHSIAWPAAAAVAASARQVCLDMTNQFRADNGKPAVVHSDALEVYADEGAAYDFHNPDPPHAHFRATNGGGIAFAALADHRSRSRGVVGGEQCPWSTAQVRLGLRECLRVAVNTLHLLERHTWKGGKY